MRNVNGCGVRCIKRKNLNQGKIKMRRVANETERLMYIRWKNMRGLRSPEWDIFSVFLSEVMSVPISDVLTRPDRSQPFSKDNFEWVTLEEHRQGKNNPNFKNATISTRCKFCGTSILSHVSAPRIYCSKECRCADGKKARTCVYCSSVFIPEYMAGTKYCSIECEQSAELDFRLKLEQKEEEKTARVLAKKKLKTIVFCKICGSRLEVYRSSGKKYCSKECYFKSVSLRQQGDKHHNWKGGVTEQRDKVRTHPLYKDWRKKVFERDDYTCQSCFSKGLEIHAHHMSSYKDNPKERLKLANGITLCGECHRQFHVFDRAGLFEGAENKFQAKAKQTFESAGFFVFNVHGGPYQTRGVPDLIMCFCGIFVAVELKVFPNFLHPLQRFQIDLIKKTGGLAYMARSEDDIERIINEVRQIAIPEGDVQTIS